MCFPRKVCLFSKNKPQPRAQPRPENGGSKNLSCPFRALSRARIRAGCGPLGLRDLVLVEQIHLTNPGRVHLASRGCGRGRRDNGGEVGAGPELDRRVRNLLAGIVQSPIGAGLRRQELLKGRRDTPAKSPAGTQSTAFCSENSEEVGGGREGALGIETCMVSVFHPESVSTIPGYSICWSSHATQTVHFSSIPPRNPLQKFQRRMYL